MNLIQRASLAFDVFRKGIPNIYGIRGYESQVGLVDARGNKTNMLAAYKSWVYAAVSIRAKSIAAAKFRVYAKMGADELEEVRPDHPLVILLEEVNPVATRSELMYVTSAHQDLTGDAYWYLPINGLGIPGECWALPADRMSIIPTRDGQVLRYELNNGTDKIPFDPSEVVHFKHPNPASFYYGQSVLMAAAASSDIDEFQHEYQRRFYQNYAVPPYALKTESTLRDDTRAKLKADWNKEYGGPNGSGKIGLLEGGLSIERIGINPKELDWLATNRATRDDILAVFGVPASKLGLVEDVNRANAEANDYTFGTNVVEPILSMMDERLTQDLARKFDPKLIIKHDSTVAGDEERQARVSAVRIAGGIATVNEERQAQGYDPVDGGDVLLVPSSLTPLSGVGRPSEPSQADVRIEALLRAISEKESVINVSAPNVNVDTPDVNVTTPPVNVHVDAPDIQNAGL